MVTGTFLLSLRRVKASCSSLMYGASLRNSSVKRGEVSFGSTPDCLVASSGEVSRGDIVSKGLMQGGGT